MTSARDEFLQRVRRAVAEGKGPAASPVLEERGAVGYQGAGSDPVAHFVARLTAAGGTAHVVPDRESALQIVLELVKAKEARRILLGRAPLLDSLPLHQHLMAMGKEVTLSDRLPLDNGQEACFAADLGISGVDSLIAETGSLVIGTRAEEPRSLSLLPPVHIVVAAATQLLPDLFDLFEAEETKRSLPACLVLITGPSKTGDIELRLVTGVHGPGEVHVVLLNDRIPGFR